ncbi:MAG: DUF2461 family protein [Prevotellaceae bacterium]|nr:DUF2461 family protein [Candidatus Minthosoma caballi]
MKYNPGSTGLQVKNCTYRIKHDIRFSEDENPYKKQHGIYVYQKNKMSGIA